MPPVPIFIDSPINAQQPDGTTPQTAAPDPGSAAGARGARPPPPTTTAATSPFAHLAPQSGARPAMPAPTGMAAEPQVMPSRTTSIPAAPSGPAPAQPGAFPSPAPPPQQWQRQQQQPQPQWQNQPQQQWQNQWQNQQQQHAKPPPPPRANELPHLSPAQAPLPPPTAAAPAHSYPPPTMPPQMSMPPPTAPHAAFSSTASAFSQVAGPAHPPPYQQAGLQFPDRAPNVTSYGRDYDRAGRVEGRTDDGEEEEGLWAGAKRWAKTAGTSLAAAESEVWRRIGYNND